MVNGPIALGYGSHFGLGLFVPVVLAAECDGQMPIADER